MLNLCVRMYKNILTYRSGGSIENAFVLSDFFFFSNFFFQSMSLDIHLLHALPAYL